MFTRGGGSNISLDNYAYGGRLTATRGEAHTYTFSQLSGKTIKAILITHETNASYTGVWIDGLGWIKGSGSPVSQFNVVGVNNNQITVYIPASSANYYISAWGE